MRRYRNKLSNLILYRVVAKRKHKSRFQFATSNVANTAKMLKTRLVHSFINLKAQFQNMAVTASWGSFLKHPQVKWMKPSTILKESLIVAA